MTPLFTSPDHQPLSRRALIETMAGCLLFAARAEAQSSPARRGPIFTHALPDLTLRNWMATAVEVNYGPGESSPAHSHPGVTIAYVLEGEIRSKVGDGPERTYARGEMFLETPGQLHAVSANASATKPAKLLAILLAENGATLTSPAK